jgi:hypothetical protein
VEIIGGKFSYKLEVFLPWMLLNRNFLKENWYYPHAGWENFCAKIFPKLLLGQCSQGREWMDIRTTITKRGISKYKRGGFMEEG